MTRSQTLRRWPAATIALAVIALLTGCSQESQPNTPTFTGSATCASCHSAEHAAWSTSQHALAMQETGDSTVLGRFDDSNLTAGGTTSRFFRRNDRYVVNTDGPAGHPADFEVRFTFGVYPLQQYLAPLPGGRLQALSLAWDSRPSSQGGQRWFHLYPDQDLKPGNPLHWTGIDQNWNYQCADCHSTNVRKNFDPAQNAYRTTWSEISVGCEACHGPASNHLTWATKGEGWRALRNTRGLVIALDERRGITWKTGPGPTAMRSTPRPGSREIGTCARCHARRGQFADAVHAGDNWLDAFRPALLEPDLYHPDGQQREEVFTWGSFLQSRMHAAGVTCADCHEPHSQRLRAPGNAVCAQCHAPVAFDVPAHHHHEPGSRGAACTACHMPATNYMVVDPRHDHSLRIPRPDLGVTLGTPDACSSCHAEQGPQWAADALRRWYPQGKPGFQTFAGTFAAARQGDPAVAGDLASLVDDTAQPAIVRASALAHGTRIGSSPALQAATTEALEDPDALVRAAAAEALQTADPAWRAEHLPALLDDPVRLVRMAAARALAGDPETRLVGDQSTQFAAALAEWTAAQRFNADRPEAHLNLGALQFARGDAAGAITAFRNALAIDPTFIPAAVNLSDVQRAAGDERGAEQTLREVLARDDSAAPAHHALGLALVRQGRMHEALAALQRAHEIERANARFAYVYAIARHDTGDRTGAIDTLRAARRLAPYDRDIDAALAAYGAE